MMMVSIKELPQISVELINKLIISMDLYREISQKYSDVLFNEEIKRLALEKKIFLKDFQSIKDFNVSDHLKENEDKINIEKENLLIKINHLFLNKSNEDVLEFVIEQENKLTDLYHLLFMEKVEDDFIRMILKNQLDETKRSIRELEELRVELNA